MSRFALRMHDMISNRLHRRHPRVTLRFEKHPDGSLVDYCAESHSASSSRVGHTECSVITARATFCFVHPSPAIIGEWSDNPRSHFNTFDSTGEFHATEPARSTRRTSQPGSSRPCCRRHRPWQGRSSDRSRAERTGAPALHERVQTRQKAHDGCHPVQKTIGPRDLLVRYIPKEKARHERLCTQFRKFQPEVSDHRNRSGSYQAASG